jgi:hypothetical protein
MPLKEYLALAWTLAALATLIEVNHAPGMIKGLPGGNPDLVEP